MRNDVSSHKPVRSFVRRAGRLTPGQRRALDQLWPRYGIDFTADVLNLDSTFDRHAPRIVEIGFGNGDLLAETAEHSPGTDFIGIEVHEPGVGHCLLEIDKRGLSNVRLIRHDAIEVLKGALPDAALSQVNLFFPDPWPKKRHHKRRIVNPAFVTILAQKIAPGGCFHVATDWMNYAEHIEETMKDSTAFDVIVDVDPARPETKFELRGKRLGHAIWERMYRRK